MGWPQITWIVLVGLTLGAELVKDGQPKTGKHSFVASLISVGVGLFLLIAGGFFSGGAE